MSPIRAVEGESLLGGAGFADDPSQAPRGTTVHPSAFREDQPQGEFGLPRDEGVPGLEGPRRIGEAAYEVEHARVALTSRGG